MLQSKLTMAGRGAAELRENLPSRNFGGRIADEYPALGQAVISAARMGLGGTIVT